MTIDRGTWDAEQYNELGPVVTDPADGRAYVISSKKLAEELRHVESIPIAKLPDVARTQKQRILTNTTQPADGGFTFPFAAEVVQVFNGSQCTLYIADNMDTFGTAEMTDYDYYVPPYSLAYLLWGTDVLTYHVAYPAGFGAQIEAIVVLAVQKDPKHIKPMITSVGKRP